MSEAENELSEQLSAWNPMQEDYTNSKFNQYSSGPGADLDPQLQPAEQARQLEASNQQEQQLQRNDGAGGGGGGGGAEANTNGNANAVPYLVFRHVPKGMTKNALFNICSRHGHVTHVRDSTKNDYFFVDLKSVADMEAVYRALENNTFGFEVRVGKQFVKKDNKTPGGNGTFAPISELQPPPQPSSNIIDMENRKFRYVGKYPPRPNFKNKPFVSHKQYADTKNNQLQRNDPLRHFLIEDDAHALERAGIEKPNVTLNANLNSKYKYQTGRAYLEMPNKTRQFIQQKNKQSSGLYKTDYDAFVHVTPNATKPGKIGECSECKRACDIICARCSMYFCGLECQQKAWSKHRYVCGKPNHLQKSVSTYDSNNNNDGQMTPLKASPLKPNAAYTSPKTPTTPPPTTTTTTPPTKLPTPPNPVVINNMPRSGNLITLTAILKTNLVFIRSKTYDDNLKFFKTIGEIQAAAKVAKPLSAAPYIGQVVLAQFECQFNRAMILNIDDLNRIGIVYMDYGNRDAKPLADLYEAPERFVGLQRFAVPVLLKDVPDCYMSLNVRKFMYSYLDNIDLQLKYKPSEDYVVEKMTHRVELIDEASNQSFNKMIASLCKPVEPRNTEVVFYRNYLKQKLLPAGENIELLIMDNSLLSTGCITCTTFEYGLEIQKFQQDIQDYGESLEEQVYAPRIDELCIVRYSEDQKWYRGRCLEIVGDGHPTIIFFDYGNIAMVNVKDIRRYPPQFTYPVYTSDCEIEGLPEVCYESLVEKLEELIPHGSKLRCDRVKVHEDDCFHSITVKRVIQQLKADGLLQEDEPRSTN